MAYTRKSIDRPEARHASRSRKNTKTEQRIKKKEEKRKRREGRKEKGERNEERKRRAKRATTFAKNMRVNNVGKKEKYIYIHIYIEKRKNIALRYLIFIVSRAGKRPRKSDSAFNVQCGRNERSRRLVLQCSTVRKRSFFECFENEVEEVYWSCI